MGTQIKTVGFGGTNDPAVKRSIGILSDGTHVAMVLDMNQTGVSGDGGDNTGVPKFYIYTSTDWSTWTLRATVNAPGVQAGALSASMVVDSSNNIRIAYRWAGTTIRYHQVNYSAGPTYTPVAGSEVVSSGLPSGYNALSLVDIDTLGDGGAVVLTGYYYNNAAGSKKTAVISYIRTLGGAWVTHAADVMMTGASHLGYTDDVTVCGDNKTVVGGDNVAVFAYNCVRRADNGTDYGDVLKLVRVNVSTGARVALHTIRSGHYAGSGGGFRKFWLYNRASNEFTLAGVVNSSPMQCGLYRFSWDRTSNTATTLHLATTGPGQGVTLYRGSNNHNWCAIGYDGGDKVVFFGIAGTALEFRSGTSFATRGGAVVSSVAELQSKVVNGNTVRSVNFRPGWQYWDSGFGNQAGYYNFLGQFQPATTAAAEQVFAGPTRNWTGPRVGVMAFHHRNDGGSPQSFSMQFRGLLAPLAPVNVTPAASSTQSTDRPTLGADYRLQMYWAQVPVRTIWYVASDSGFTTNLRQISESDADFILPNGTSTGYLKKVTTTEPLPGSAELTQGTWYVRALTFDYLGNAGAWSGNNSFTVTHPPVPANLYPTGGAVFIYGGSGSVTFNWKFTDPSPYDSQTAYRIVIETADDGAVLVDSGKIASTVQSATLTVPIGGKDVNLRWKMTLWDSDDVAGPESGYQLFYATDPPAPAITSPAGGAVLTSAIPTVQWTTGIGGSKQQAAYRVEVTQGNFRVYSSGWITSIDNAHTVPVGYLVNDQSYTISVELQDDLGLTGRTSITVSTDWVEPGPPDPNWEVFLHDYAKRGYVYITWVGGFFTDSDFAAWIVYRRRIGEASWERIASYTNGAERYAHRDYGVASGQTYEYTITQMVDRFGDLVESLPGKIVRVTPDSDQYWIVDLVEPEKSIPIYSVTSDNFKEEYEQETYTVIGRGRHVDYGERLGYAGSLNAQVRDKFLSGVAKTNYLINPAMSYQSVPGAPPDGWSIRTQDTAFSDAFTRSTSNGLGTSWTTSGGSSSNYSTNGSQAVISVATKGVDYVAIPTLPSSIRDFDITFLVGSPDMTADAGSNNPTFSTWVRYVDGNNNLRVKAWFTSSGITLNFTERISATEVTNGSFPAVSGTSINTPTWIRVQGIGGAIKVMGWADGGSPPSTWQIEFTTTLTSAGAVRFGGTLPAAYTGTVPKTYTLDNLTIASLPNLGDLSSGYVEARNPSPTGKTPYRLQALGMGGTINDKLRIEQLLSGNDYPDSFKVTGAQATLTSWVAKGYMAGKVYRLTIEWLDSGGTTLAVTSGPAIADRAAAAVETYIPSTSADVARGNSYDEWFRFQLQSTVPAGSAGVRVTVAMEGDGSFTSGDAQLIVSGAQLEAGSRTPYIDGDQAGAEWSGTPQLSSSTTTGYYTARQQLKALEEIKSRKTKVYLRNPFGDIWLVAPGDIGVNRVAGVGRSEFVDIDIPYQEVSF